MKSASATASSTSAVTDTEPPESFALACATSIHSSGAWYSAGAAWTKRMPNWVVMNISELHTFVRSPTNTTVQSSRRRPGGRCSVIVSRSHTTWVGWLKSVRPLITGTSAAAASARIVSCSRVRASITSHMRERTRAVSATDSRPPRWISPGFRYRAWPPSFAIATSKETRVRVDGSSKIIPSERRVSSCGTAASRSASFSSRISPSSSSSS